MAEHPRGQQRPPADYSAAARTGSDQEYTYLAVGMVAGAIPGVIAGLLVSLALGHAAMWVSVIGGAGIVIGLVAASILWRRRRARLQQDQDRPQDEERSARGQGQHPPRR